MNNLAGKHIDGVNQHSGECRCGTYSTALLTNGQLLAHVGASQNSRRAFIKKFGVSLALAGPYIPLAASALNNVDSGRQSEHMFQNKAVKDGKAEVLTILHTADIHAQLLTHDEFFMENGKAVYRKRGGYAVLKTMIDQLRSQNPSNTLLIDGGDCFQGSGVAALSKGA